MSKVFKRPMFRGGGNVNTGILSGIRDNFSNGTPSERIAKAREEFSKPAFDPVAQLLIQGGLSGFSTTGQGGTAANLAKAFEGPTAQFFSNLSTQQQSDEKMAVEGVLADINQEIENEKLKIKNLEIQQSTTKFDKQMQNKIDVKIQDGKNKIAELEYKKNNPTTTGSNFQKDFTPDRKYYELMKDRTNSAAELNYGQRANIEQKFPRGTAQFDAYYSTDLLQSDNPVAKEIRSSFERFVPFDSKKGTLNYNDMIPGMYYYDPKRSVYITNVPPSDEDAEGGFYVVNPTTYEKRKLNP